MPSQVSSLRPRELALLSSDRRHEGTSPLPAGSTTRARPPRLLSPPRGSQGWLSSGRAVPTMPLCLCPPFRLFLSVCQALSAELGGPCVVCCRVSCTDGACPGFPCEHVDQEEGITSHRDRLLGMEGSSGPGPRSRLDGWAPGSRLSTEPPCGGNRSVFFFLSVGVGVEVATYTVHTLEVRTCHAYKQKLKGTLSSRLSPATAAPLSRFPGFSSTSGMTHCMRAVQPASSAAR